MEDLQTLRAQINKVDDEIAKLYLQRIEIIKKIGKIKKQQSMSLDNPSREIEILNRFAQVHNDEEMVFVKKLYEFIFLESKKLQGQAK